MKVYHYTSEDGLKGIQSSMMIHESTDTTKDAMLGYGVYFTTMDPGQHSKEEILQNNYDSAIRAMHVKRMDYAIEVEIPIGQLKENPGMRNVWVHPGSVYLNDYPHRFIRVSDDLKKVFEKGSLLRNVFLGGVIVAGVLALGAVFNWN
ncbi:unnamed protein product [Owenia fusiformis]|uniref:Uncharacterized protein n=1 Tax=Owenia fusiformis TaxID=6347 RepID=A0A8J1U8N2_OWEFU|nr:unnamed protein product [Owenia fusiformis]